MGRLEYTLEKLDMQYKGPYLNTLDRHHIYKTKKTKLLHNDTHYYTYNPIFLLLTISATSNYGI